MKKLTIILTVLLAFLAAASICSGQAISGVRYRKPYPVTWSVVQFPGNDGCTTASCSITGVTTTPGDLLILVGAAASSDTLTFSSASGDGTWTHCPSAATELLNSGVDWAVDCVYRVAATGMTSGTLTFTWSAPGTFYGGAVQLVEVHRSTGTATYDSSGGSSSTSCTSCAGPTLSITGRSDYVLTITASTGSSTGPAAPWTNPYSFAIAGASNQKSGTTATWPFSSPAATVIGAVAFK